MSDDIKIMFEKMREFTNDKNIVFVTPKAKLEPTIADTAFGIDLPTNSVEFINDAQYLTVRRGKHRRGQSESFNVECIMDPPRFSFREVIRSITGENDIDQDMPEVKELPPPKPAED